MVFEGNEDIRADLLSWLKNRQTSSVPVGRMRLAREPGAGSGERGAGKKRAGSRDCRKKSRNS
jgi:hypothetical protein